MWDKILESIEKGQLGGNKGIPTLLNVPEIYIAEGRYNIVGGSPNSGKTSFADYLYVLSPNNCVEEHDYHIIYFSMERSPIIKFGKWVCANILMNTGINLSPEQIFGWTGYKLKEEEKKALYDSEVWFNGVKSKMSFYNGAQNPTGIMKTCETYFKNNGAEYKKKVNYSKNLVFDRYEPNNPNKKIIIVIDHANAIRTESGKSLKESIDLLSKYLVELRDRYGATVCLIQQFNRSMGDSNRKREGDVLPRRDDLKDTSSTYEDADFVLGLLDPLEYQIDSFYGYQPARMRTENGVNRFRSVTIIKNSFGVNGKTYALGFYGESGVFKRFPKPNEATRDIYEQFKTYS